MNQKILNSNMSIRWVVALKAEAEMILEEFNMNLDPEFTLFQVFSETSHKSKLFIQHPS